MKVLIYYVLILLTACTFQHGPDVKSVNLSNRKLSAIPDSIYSMDKLEYLDLSNGLTIYPPLSALPTGEMSQDSMNEVTQIAENISQLRQLKVLNVRTNDLRSLPQGLLKLKLLDTLDISFNRHLLIADELDILGKMTWLKYLNITATNVDQYSVDEIKKSLPSTKIIVRMDEMIDREMVDSIINSVISSESD